MEDKTLAHRKPLSMILKRRFCCFEGKVCNLGGHLDIEAGDFQLKSLGHS